VPASASGASFEAPSEAAAESSAAEVPDTYSTELVQSRASFRDTVWARLAVEDEAGKRLGAPPLRLVAEEVEAATHAWAAKQPGGSVEKHYLTKMRSLCFNLKKNASLRGKVRSGEVNGAELAAMDKDQLADATVVEGRAKMERKLAEEVGQGCTHKRTSVPRATSLYLYLSFSSW
jgi:hypothetical protein